MNPTRKRRLALIGLVLAAAALAATFIALALQENLSYLHTPTEVLAKHDETYMPPEVAKGMSPEMLAKMEGGDARHSLTCGAD